MTEDYSPESGDPALTRKKAVVLTALVLSSLSLLVFVAVFSVNLFYYDAWDAFWPILEKKSWLELFTLQFGPHRLGLGIWLSKIGLSLTHWNARTEPFLIAMVMIGSCGLALHLRRRLGQSWSYWDILFIAHFLSLASWESLVGTPVLSFGAVPLFLILGGAYCLSLEDISKRNLSLALMSVPLAFTCHGQLTLPLIVVCLGSTLFRPDPKKTKGLTGIYLILITAMITYLALTYRTGWEGADCLNTEGSKIWNMLQFAGAYSLALFGLYMYLPGLPILGIGLYLCLIGLWVGWVIRWAKRDDSPTRRVIIYLLGFTLLHATLSAYGRSCIGVRAAYTSRYFVYMLPAYCGVYFWIFMGPLSQWKKGILGGLLAAHLLLQAFLAFHQLPKVAEEMEKRREIADCLRDGVGVLDCETRANYSLMPDSQALGLPKKVERLRELRLGPFSPAAQP